MTDIEAYRACWRSTESLSARLRSLVEEFEDDDWGTALLEASADRMDTLQRALQDAINLIERANFGAFENGNAHQGSDEGEVLASRELGRLKDILEWKESSKNE